jgi:hypothetical protein
MKKTGERLEIAPSLELGRGIPNNNGLLQARGGLNSLQSYH